MEWSGCPRRRNLFRSTDRHRLGTRDRRGAAVQTKQIGRLAATVDQLFASTRNTNEARVSDMCRHDTGYVSGRPSASENRY